MTDADTAHTEDHRLSARDRAELIREAYSAESYYIFGHKRVVTLIGLGLVQFVAGLDATIVSVALPTIGADFDDYGQSSWIVTAYLITYTAFLPIVSKLTDVLGRRPVLVFSTIFFMAFSGACGGAKSMNELIAFRALQGVGGSAIFSAVVVTISSIVPVAEVAKYAPQIGGVYALASIAGPLIGGAIIAHTHWGWIFYVNLPIGFLGVLCLLYGLQDPHQGQLKWWIIKERIDWIGCFLLISSSVLLSFALQVGGTIGYPWKSVKVLVPLVLSVLLLPLFCYVESHRYEPVVPLHLFRMYNYPFIVLFTVCLGAGFFTITIYLPQRMEVVQLASAITSGVHMLPMLLLVGALSGICGGLVVVLKSYRPLMWVCSAVGAVGCGLLSMLGVDTNLHAQYGYEVMIGFSIGATIATSMIIVQWCTERVDLAVATGFQVFARQMGALIGIAASTAILNGRVSAKLDSLTGAAAALDTTTVRDEILQDPTGVLAQLTGEARTIVQEAYSDGFSKVFLAAAVWMAVGTLATLPLEHKLPPELMTKPKSGEKRDPEKGIPEIREGVNKPEAAPERPELATGGGELRDGNAAASLDHDTEGDAASGKYVSEPRVSA